MHTLISYMQTPSTSRNPHQEDDSNFSPPPLPGNKPAKSKKRKLVLGLLILTIILTISAIGVFFVYNRDVIARNIQHLPNVMKICLAVGADPNGTRGPERHLQRAFEAKDYETARVLLEAGAETDFFLKEGDFLITDAVYKKDWKMLNMLLEFGSDINLTKFDIAYTPIYYAARAQDREMIIFLLSKGATLEGKGGDEALIKLVEKGNIELAQLLLDNGANINAQHEYRDSSPGARAAQQQNVAMFNMLKKYGPNLKGITFERIIDSKNLELIELLLKQGIPVSNSEKNTYLRVALNTANVPLIELLLKYGFFNPRDKEQNSFCTFSITFNGNPEIAKLLLKYGFNLNQPNSIGIPPLGQALEAGHIAVAKVFLDHHAEINLTDKHGYDILTRSSNKLESVKFLLANGYKIDRQNKTGQTALHHLANRNNLEAIKLLIERGANPNIKDNKGRTPLQLANKQELRDYLISHGAK